MFEEDAIALLEDHDWSGNVRELENFMLRLAVLAEERGTIDGALVAAELQYPYPKEATASDGRLPTTNLNKLNAMAVRQACGQVESTKELAHALGLGDNTSTARTLMNRHLKPGEWPFWFKRRGSKRATGMNGWQTR